MAEQCSNCGLPVDPFCCCERGRAAAEQIGNQITGTRQNRNVLVKRLIEQGLKTPYFNLDGYMNRLWLSPNPKNDPDQTVSARLHQLLRADTDDVMHDHPSDNISIVQSGGYYEIVPADQAQDPALDSTQFVSHRRVPGDVVFRKATHRHRIIAVAPEPVETWSLFICGPWKQDWGFYLPDGKVYWREYLNEWGDDPAPGEASQNVRPTKR